MKAESFSNESSQVNLSENSNGLETGKVETVTEISALETETRPIHLDVAPRRDRDETMDNLETDTSLSRPIHGFFSERLKKEVKHEMWIGVNCSRRRDKTLYQQTTKSCCRRLQLLDCRWRDGFMRPAVYTLKVQVFIVLDIRLTANALRHYQHA